MSDVAAVMLDLVRQNNWRIITAPAEPATDNDLDRLKWRDSHSSRWQHLTRCRDTAIENLSVRTGYIGYCSTCTESVLIATCDVACTCHYREQRVVLIADDHDCVQLFGRHGWEIEAA